MSLKDAERNLKGMGRTIANNTPGPKQLLYGARETARGIWVIWVVIALMFFFGEPLARWLNEPTAPQKEGECRPQPGYCDIDTDWRPPAR